MNPYKAISADLVIVMPVFDDWAAVSKLLRQFDEVRSDLPERLHVILVDDGSVARCPEGILNAFSDQDTTIEVLRLARNLGHQRAIAVALCYVCDYCDSRGVLVMDCDGEDPPQAIPGLLEQSYDKGNDCVVFASRKRRSESLVFSLFYHIYRSLHFILTGIPVRVGNFSYIPHPFIRRLAVSSELWNHYAATVFVSKLPYTSIPIARARRLEGRSRMGFSHLVSHGLASMSVFSALVGTRVLVTLAVSLGLALVLLALVLAVRVFTTLAIPGWATFTVGILLLLITQLLSLSAVFVFGVLGARGGAHAIPLRDYRFFVDRSLPPVG